MRPWHRYRSAIGGGLGLALLAFAFSYRWFGPTESPVINAEGVATGPRVDVQAAIQRALAGRDGAAGKPELVGPPVELAGSPARPAPEAPVETGATLSQLSAEVMAEVDDALARAQKALKKQQLIAPAQDSALYWYDAALELDAKSKPARDGRRKLVTRLLEQANTALNGGDGKFAGELLLALDSAQDLAEEKAELAARIERLEAVAPLLAEGLARFRAGKLADPAGESALDSYRAVLALDPNQGAAKQGLAEIEQAVLKQALGMASQNDFDAADKLIALADTIQAAPDLERDTRARVAELKRDFARALLERATAALDAQDLAAAEPLLAQAEALAVADEVVAGLRVRLANARVYEHRNPGERFADAFIDHTGSGPGMIVIPLGSFEMGSPEAEPGRRREEGPRHLVQIARAFSMARTELTVGEFRRFIDATGYQTDAERIGNSSYYDEANGRISIGPGLRWDNDYKGAKAGDDLPVLHVSWNDASAYVAWLAQRTGKPYRLPSEAEFEYALRAGSQTQYWWGNNAPLRNTENVTGAEDRSPSERSWSKAFNRYGDGHWGPAPAGKLAANPFGLHDMAGNLSEWVEDCWHDGYIRAPADGLAWVNKGCERRVVRGGSWGSPPEQVRSAMRLSTPADTRSGRVGFRVARDL